MKRAAEMLFMAVPFITVSLSAQNIAPVADHLVVIGEARPGMTIWASYVYNDADDTEGSSIIQWYSASDQYGNDTALIPAATGDHYLIKDSDFGSFLGFIVIPYAQGGPSPGDTAMTTLFTEVLANKPPEARNRSITGSLNVGDVLTGHYTYYDYENDYEFGSELKWYGKLASESTWTQISTGISYKITMGDQRRFFRLGIIPKAITGTDSNIESFAPQVGPANSAPYADNIYVTGTKIVGQPLTGHYSYHDYDPADYEGATTFQWYRGTELIPGATSLNYYPVGDDVGRSLVFKVTPVTYGTGNPVIGSEVAGLPYGPVTDPSSGTPTASQLCIDGNMLKDNQLKGRYLYSNSYTEKNSKYLWYVNGVLVETSTYNSSYKYARYTLRESDIGKKVYFAVIPQNKNGDIGDTAKSAPFAYFTKPVRDIFSVTDPAQELEASLPGGVFSGPGESVSGNFFYPSKLASSDDPYTLNCIVPIVQDSIQCNQTAYKNVLVRPVAISFSGLDPFYCDDKGPDTVYILNMPPLAVSSTFSITDPRGNLIPVNKLSLTSAVFNPDNMSSGDGYIMSFSCKDFLGLTYTANQSFIVDHIGKVKISNLKADTTFCNNLEPFELFTSQQGGTFTGLVVGNKLDISNFYGNTVVTYRITTAHCTKADIVPITVYPAPVVSFVPKDYCILDIDTDSTRMNNNTTWVDPVKTWRWEFTEGGMTTIDTNKTAAYLYRTGGSKKIYLTATTIHNCAVRKSESFDLGVKPTADFRWEKDCYHPGSSIFFFDDTKVDPNVTIMSRRWDFNHGDSIMTVINPVYPQEAVGPISVLYKVTTAYAGCDDEIFRTVYIKPTIDLSSDDYFEDFEDGSSDWTFDYEAVNNWKFGTPDRLYINEAAPGGVNAWYTGFRTDTIMPESSSIISPCFDFSVIERPMISLDLWKRLEKDHQGAALQYKIGDASTWEYVGTLEDGINWYNSALIRGRPGGEQIGWTSDTLEKGFNNARHKLDGLAGRKDVKFRIAYGSDGSTLRDGIAFDNIWIGSKTRKVLIEHFTNISSRISSNTNQLVDTIAKSNPDDVIYIQYHTNFPGNDQYYNDNPEDASARILYYGLSRTPYSFIDGGSDHDNYASLYDYSISSIDANEVARRSLINTLFDIDINADATEGVLTVNGTIKALDEVNAENLTLYLAVTEKENREEEAANGDTVFMNVFRKMIPDAGGINLKKSWTKDEIVTVPSQSWMIENIRDNSKIEVIAFLQNNVTRVVYQAASVRDLDIGVGIGELPMAGKINFALYPNPAVNKLTIDFREPLTGDADIRIYDLQGNIVSVYMAGSDITQFTIDNLNLKQGIYLVRISGKGRDLGFRKLVVNGRL